MDASQSLSEPVMDMLFETLNRYSVLYMRNQKLDHKELIRFCSQFGPIKPSNQNRFFVPGVKELHIISNVMDGDRYIGNPDAGVFWHTDAAYMEKPVMYTFLYAIEVPMADGSPRGSTHFASTATAYEALPANLKEAISGLSALNSLAHQAEKKRQVGLLKRGEITEYEKQTGIQATHPIVRTHPKSGRKSIYVSEGHTTAIVDMPKAQSDELLKKLNEHVTQPQFIYTHDWQVGDLLVWDNCTTVHKATFDYALPQRRVLYRAIIGGDVTF